MMRLALKNFSTKLSNWEYWPFGIIQLPLIFMWLWYSLKERSFFYFTASNPGIFAGGMMGESKFEVLSMLPEDVKPKTLLVKHGSSLAVVKQLMKENDLVFPVIFKPDLGERGWMVKRINNDQEILKYLAEIKIDFIVQELIDLPLEFGVFYVRFPNEEQGFVNSITAKEFLWVQGDGKRTLRDLILENDRARLQWNSLQKEYGKKMDAIIPEGMRVELVSIGNHCLGTKFLNANHLITEKLSVSFDRISQQLPGFYFGRYDLRCGSIDDLENGKVKIMELNGCGAEPAHIYHPKASLLAGVRDLITHWQNLYRISRENHERGVEYISFREGRAVYRKFVALRA